MQVNSTDYKMDIKYIVQFTKESNLALWSVHDWGI